MFNSVLYTKLRKALGLHYVMKNLGDIKKMIAQAIDHASPDAKGNYIERGLAEMERDEAKSAFVKRMGREQLAEQLLDLFAGGKLCTQYFNKSHLSHRL